MARGALADDIVSLTVRHGESAPQEVKRDSYIIQAQITERKDGTLGRDGRPRSAVISCRAKIGSYEREDLCAYC
jgi:hypothetical protein